MADIIQLLPDSVANQIAAGEVIQRPSSVVKELMENALDAGAQEIKVQIKDSGKTLIQVIDDGSGMSNTDARLSFERHATSKVRKAEDLFSLRTMGFRGEALASIAAVSQVEMKTCLSEQELGTFLLVEGSHIKRQEQEVCRKGTIIRVKNIFFNIPARRAFLKSNQVEMKHIVDEFQYLAIAHSNKSFVLTHGEQVIFDLTPGKLSQRIVALFGNSYKQQLATCKEETSSLNITGYIGHPESAKKTRGNQYLFVNNRYIKSSYLNHAIVGAFEGLLPEGSYPFYMLFIEIDPTQIDVNVHPTKTEIKFEDARTLYAIVRATVKKALGLHNFIPTIDFKTDINVIDKMSSGTQSAQSQYFNEQLGPLRKNNSSQWQSLFTPDNKSIMDDNMEKTVQLESAVNQNKVLPVARVAFQCHHKYIIREVQNGLMIINQQAAHERILHEKYLISLQQSKGESQQSLFPQAIEFEPADFALVMEMEEEIKSLGFRFEVFGKYAILVSGTPPNALGKEKEIFEGFIEQFKINKSELSLPLQENLAWALAKRVAIKQGQSLDQKEIDALVEGLFSCKMPNLSTKGKSIFFILEISKMDHLLHS